MLGYREATADGRFCMSMYSNILLPTDFSEVSLKAARRTRSIVEATGARLTLLHVVDYVPPSYATPELPTGLGSSQTLIRNAREQLDRWARNAGLETASKQVVSGPAKTQIMHKVRELNADLLVMGTHGEHGIARLLGSTTRAVLHDAACDVLVVPAHT